MKPLLLGLTGFPLGHSFSKKWFAEKFRSEAACNIEYINLPVETPEQLSDLLKIENLAGFNVTAPYKTAIIRHLDELDPTAEAIGAVNCVVRNGEKWKGYNTDWRGFMLSLEEFLGTDSHPEALILGSGGASKAAEYAMERMSIKWRRVSRSADGRSNNLLNYAQLSKEVIAAHRLIVNTTPLGTFPNTDNAPDIPYEYLTTSHKLYDMVYNPPQTKFMLCGQYYGASATNGQRMLELQAEESWQLFRQARFTDPELQKILDVAADSSSLPRI